MTTRHESFDTHSEDDYERLLAAYHQSMLSGESDSLDVEGAVEMSGALDVLRMMERNRQLTDDVDDDVTIPEPISDTQQAAQDTVEDERRIGRFEIIRRLGAGGGGVVMLARDPQLKREVALKIPNPDALMRDEFVQRFQREARVAAGLKHPNIVTVLETGSIGPICYIATDYCNGPNLNQWLKQHNKALTPIAAASLIRTLADATQHAHSRGVLHRDIKPSNVLFELGQNDNQLLSEDQLAPAARLADFGLAKQIDDSVNMTAPAAVVGTPAYMSPEQASGETSEAGTHSDTFSLGVVLYELLTGESPFARDSALSTLEAVRRHEPKHPRTLNPAVPPDLDAVCYRSIEKRPTDRYGTAAALVEDLDNFIGGRPVNARPISTTGRVWRWARRNLLASILFATVGVLVVAIAIGSSLAAVNIKQSRDKTLDALEAKSKAHATALAAVYEARVAHAQSLRRTGQAGQRIQSLSSLRKAAALMDELKLDSEAKTELRTEAIAALSIPDLTRETEWEWTKPTDFFFVNRLDAQCERYARPADSGRAIEICDARTSKVRTTLKQPEGTVTAGAFLFSSDGKYLAERFRRGKNFNYGRVWNLETSKPVAEFAVSGTPRKMVAREHIAYDFNEQSTEFCVARKKTVRVFSLPDGEELEQVDMSLPIASVRFSPNGERIAVGTVRAVVLLDRAKLSEVTKDNTRVTSMAASRMAWSDNGRLLAVAIDRRVQIWDMQSGKQIMSLWPHARRVIDLDFHPNGENLLSLAGDGTTHLWEVTSGNRLLRWPETRCTHFSPDGTLVASRDGLLRFQPASLSRLNSSADSLPPGPAAKAPLFRILTSWVAIHPTSRLAVRGTGSHVYFFDLAQAKSICRVKVPLGQCVFSADGRFMYGLTFKNRLLRYPITIESNENSLLVRIEPIGEPVPLTEIPEKWPTASDADQAASRFSVIHDTHMGLRFLDRQAGSYHNLNTKKMGGNWSAISPDGDVAATSSRKGKVRIWNLRTGEVVQTLESPSARVRFQPTLDDPILAVTEANRLRFFRRSRDSGRWEVVHKQGAQPGVGLPAYMRFSPEGRYFAFRRTRSETDLIDMMNFETVAQFTVPDGTMAAEVYFSPNGSRLFVGTNEDYFHIWSLDEINSKLNGMQLGLESKISPMDTYPTTMTVDWTPDYPKTD